MEQFSNNGSAILSNGSTLTSGATTTTVASAVNIPSSGTFRILIDNELIKVTAVSGSTWTLVRGDGGTTAASHADGSNIYVIVTKEAVDALVSILANGTEISNRRVLNFIGPVVTDNSGSARCDIKAAPLWEATLTTPPAAASWSSANMGSGSNLGTLTDSGIGVFLRDSVQSTTWADHARVVYQTVPTAPWTVIAKVVPFITGQTKQWAGLCFFNSSTHAMADVRFSQIQTGIVVGKWTDYNTYSADYIAFNGYPHASWRWFKLQDDNTNRIISVSADGTNWIKIHTIGRTDFMTADSVGFYANANNNNGTQNYDAGILMLSWNLGSGLF